MPASTEARVKEQDAFLKSHTVHESLQSMNSDPFVSKDVASYYEYVPFGDPYEYAGPELLTLWFQRNLRIYCNLVKLIDTPSDRILVIYGAGHLGWLRPDIS